MNVYKTIEDLWMVAMVAKIPCIPEHLINYGIDIIKKMEDLEKNLMEWLVEYITITSIFTMHLVLIMSQKIRMGQLLPNKTSIKSTHAGYLPFHQNLTKQETKTSMSSPELLPIKRDDIYLVQAFQQHGYKNSKLIALNICRKYLLQVVTLGDITVTNGSLILPNIKAGIHHTISSSTYSWPQQTLLDEKSWGIWR